MTELPKSPAPATREEANAFLKDIEREEDEVGIHVRVMRYGRDALERIVRRLYTDALKSPSQKRGELPTKRITEADSIESSSARGQSPSDNDAR
jgi:hypothetical protein